MKTNKSRKRLCSALLCLILTVSMLPITGYAGEGEDEATGGSAVQYPIEINEKNFPDAAFRNYIQYEMENADLRPDPFFGENKGWDSNRDGKLDQSEIAKVTEIRIDGKEYGVKSLQGIELFSNLDSLTINNVNLDNQELDVSKLTSLESLDCNDNNLTKLNLGEKPALTTLFCSRNQLTSLYVSKYTALIRLDCAKNRLASLDVSALTELNSLDCNDNKLTSLDVSKNVELKYLYCNNNKLALLDISKNGKLRVIECDNNRLTLLDVSQQTQLQRVYCSGNCLTSLNLSKNTYNAGGWANHWDNNVYPIQIGKDRNFDLSTLPGSFDISKTTNWSGGSVDTDTQTLTVDVNADRVTYSYACEYRNKTLDVSLIPNYYITLQTEGSGTASVNLTSAAKGEQVILMAAPSEGYQFKAWEIVSGNITINDNKFTMPAKPVTVKAIFEQKKYAVTVQTEGNGTASASVASVKVTSAAKGEQVTLTAAPNEGYEFKEWQVVSGNITINDNKFTMPASEVTIKASFKKKAASGGSSGGGAYVPSTPAAPSNPKPSGSAVTSDVSGSTSRKDGETSTKVDQSTADKLVDAAIDNKSTDIVIDTASKTENGGVPNVKASEVTLPTETIKNIAEKTDASLTIKTDVGEIKLDNKAAASVSKQGENIGAPGEQETISIIAKKVKEDTEEVRYELEIKNSGGKTISDFRGGTATITVPVPSGLQGESLICVYIDKKGHYNKVKGKWTADGRYAFSTGHFSTYAMMREITADTVIAKQKAAVRKMTMEVRTKIVKTKSGKQAIRVTWTSGGKIIPDGVQIYRSTKKGGSFGKKPIFTTEKTRYLNTAVKTGQRYYYKVRGYVTIDGETVYTKLSGKGNRKLPETV